MNARLLEIELTRDELAGFKKRLEAKRLELQPDIRMTREAFAIQDRPADPLDSRVSHSEREVAISVADSGSATLRRVVYALAQLQAGRYGRCENCANPIPKVRLKAVPEAPYCARCQGHLEAGHRGQKLEQLTFASAMA